MKRKLIKEGRKFNFIKVQNFGKVYGGILRVEFFGKGNFIGSPIKKNLSSQKEGLGEDANVFISFAGMKKAMVSVDMWGIQNSQLGGMVQSYGSRGQPSGCLPKLALTQCELALTQCELALTQCELALTQCELALMQCELALMQCELALTQWG